MKKPSWVVSLVSWVKLLLVAVGLAFLLTTQDPRLKTAFACPGCKDAISSSENPAAAAKLTQGWARSITLLMWTPYLLFGGVTFAILRSHRKETDHRDHGNA